MTQEVVGSADYQKTEGERHPTRGGLRIGKPLNKHQRHEPANSQLEWEQDGQYFHYLTKWMHALYRMGRKPARVAISVGLPNSRWPLNHAFIREMRPGGPKRMVWKMSIDLTRPLVPSMGQHDPLDGLVTYLELQTAENSCKRNLGWV